MVSRAAVRVAALCVLLFSLNAYICHELFSIEFTKQLQSNEGAFLALSRFFLEHGFTAGWFPWWNAGMPVQNAYPPLLPGLTALLSAGLRWNPAHAFHVLIAVMYCSGPVTLFLFAFQCSGRLSPSFLSGVAYSLLSPSALLIPTVRFDNGGGWNPQRLNNLVFFGESPHISALTLVPVALLFCHLTLTHRRPRYFAVTIGLCGSIFLTNTIGATTLLIGIFCLVLARAERQEWVVAAAMIVTSYSLISPWIPPSLLRTLARNSWTAGGDFRMNGWPALVPVGFCLSLLLLWRLTLKRGTTFERFTLLFATTLCSIPILDYSFHCALVPQPRRYHLELEMVCCLASAFALLRITGFPRHIAIGMLTVLFLWQTIVCRSYARQLTEPVKIDTTVEYRVARFLDLHLHGARVMIAGDAAYWSNVFFDVPQFSGGHEPSAPNWMQRVAVYTIYSGMNAGSRDAAISIFWLKAFGNSAIYVPGRRSREYFHPFANPAKFDGLLPILWHEEDDTVFEVLVRSSSLAHAIPEEASVSRAPLNGLDLDPARSYVAALDDGGTTEPALKWSSSDRGTIEALIKPQQVISLQITYDPGWHASIAGVPRRIRQDGLGLMIIHPECYGPCKIDLAFGATTETWLCRILSVTAFLAVCGPATFRMLPILIRVTLNRRRD